MGLEAGIWASRLGFGPQGWDLDLKAGIWALRLGSESVGGRAEEKEKEKKEKSVHSNGTQIISETMRRT